MNEETKLAFEMIAFDLKRFTKWDWAQVIIGLSFGVFGFITIIGLI